MFSASDVIYSYSRADALADGQLIDVSETAREAGFMVPVALTSAVWADCVAWGEAEEARKGALQDEDGRLWDVLYMAYRAAMASRNASRVQYEIRRIPREGKGLMVRRVALVLCIGPGDTGEPVITIMQPNED